MFRQKLLSSSVNYCTKRYKLYLQLGKNANYARSPSPGASICDVPLSQPFPVYNIHLMYGPEGNSQFCFPKSPDVSREEVEGNIRTRGKTKLNQFPEGPYIKCFVIYLDFHIAKTNKQSAVRATTAQLYPGRDTFDFDQGHVTKNQPIAVLILLSESLAI